MAVESPKGKKSVPEGLWTKCNKCEQIIFNKELETNLKICPKCGYYFPMNAFERIGMLLDPDSFKETDAHLMAQDALGFTDLQPYATRLSISRKKTGLKDAAVTGHGTIDGHAVVIGVLDFGFLGGSMGSVVGERFTRAAEAACTTRHPLILVSSSGGARMQESILSLMQMAKTSSALSTLRDAGVPYISILTHPTTGGVTASFAMLGDVIIAEPKALIAFAGPRVIEQTIRQELPPGFQQAEFVLEHGMIDIICPRNELRDMVKRTIKFFAL
ncbi:MAG: acetyl-CoA carboxylase carboxyltransferase subunit beta [Elusimicrobia bacterium]|nr:acetyl-CoA carboxylase carboxyltransferase subunit beta [Elusimicrobiota bacterium]MBD3412690.1 acetyl-CoA carboxylase carboxyltransferase subunit beta [Elusimicrobiota bacterium]